MGDIEIDMLFWEVCRNGGKSKFLLLIRAFVQLREMVLTNEKLSMKFEQLEKRVTEHDDILMQLVQEIRKLIDSPKTSTKKAIGFRSPDKK